MSLSQFRTVGQVAHELGEPLHRVEYVIRSRGIEASSRVGILRVFDLAAVDRIRAALKRDRRNPDTQPAPACT